MLSGSGVEASLSAGPDILTMSGKSEGSWVIKGHTIIWSMTVSAESNPEILITNRTTHREEMADWLVEMAVKEATQREELPKEFEELKITNKGGDDVIILDYGAEQKGREDDTTMSWEEALGTSDQVQKQRNMANTKPGQWRTISSFEFLFLNF